MSCLHDGYFTLGLDADPEVAETIRGELGRQQNGIELIAPENMVSRQVWKVSYRHELFRAKYRPWQRF